MGKKTLLILSLLLATGALLSAKPKKLEWSNLGLRTKVQAPINYKQPQKQLDYFLEPYEFRVYSRSFSQGEAGYVEAIPSKSSKIGFNKIIKNYTPFIRFQNKKILLKRYDWGWGAIFAIHPDKKSGNQSIVIGLVGPDGSKTQKSQSIKIMNQKFPNRKIRIDESAYASKPRKEQKKMDKFIRDCLAKKKTAFGRRSSNFLNNALSHPRDFHYITSAYWTKRTYNYFRVKNGKRENTRQKVRRHKGLDLKGKTGDPVFSMARGYVALAQKMHFEGGFVILDHGNGIFTAYMHLEKIHVKVGQIVNAGQLIASVGSTGYVTGPHLDVSFYVGSTALDPLSLLSLPLR